MESLLTFIDNKETDKFAILNVLSLYFEEKNENFLGAYPGPINNFHLLSFSDIWFDPENNFLETNLPLKMNLKENSNFIILDKLNYEFLKTIFGCYFELPRKSIKSNDEIILEVHYFKVRIY